MAFVLNRTKPWGAWGCWGYLLVQSKFGRFGAVRNRSVGQNLPMLSFGGEFPFNVVSRATKDDKGALFSAGFAMRMSSDLQNKYLDLERLVRGSIIRFGWSIYSLKLVGMNRKIDTRIREEPEVENFHAVVISDPSVKMKKLIEWHSLPNPFSYEPRLDLNFEESCLRIFTVESHTIIPVDVRACKECYKYALSAVYIHNYIEEDKICFEELLCASKLEVDGGAFYFLLLRGEDNRGELDVYCAILKVSLLKEELIKWHVVGELFSIFEKTNLQ